MLMMSYCDRSPSIVVVRPSTIFLNDISFYTTECILTKLIRNDLEEVLVQSFLKKSGCHGNVNGKLSKNLLV